MKATWTHMTPEERCVAIVAVHSNTVCTARTIAAALSEKFEEAITRNSIIGLYHRNPVALKGAPLNGDYTKPVKVAAKPRADRPRPQLVKKNKTTPELMAQEKKIFERAQALPAPAPLNMTLLELNHNDCRWPVSGEGAKMLFCGHNVEDGKSYCPCHVRMSVGRGTESERNAVYVGKAA